MHEVCQLARAPALLQSAAQWRGGFLGLRFAPPQALTRSHLRCFRQCAFPRHSSNLCQIGQLIVSTPPVPGRCA